MDQAWRRCVQLGWYAVQLAPVLVVDLARVVEQRGVRELVLGERRPERRGTLPDSFDSSKRGGQSW
jgi:hypothetical protein